MNRTQALRVEALTRRLRYLERQLDDLGPDAPQTDWVTRERDAIAWALRVVRAADRAGGLSA
jgi:hypothetical protein